MYKIIPYHPLYRDEIIELRNKYIEYLRQPFPLTIKDQVKWEETTNDIYFILIDQDALYKSDMFKGVAGLTSLDFINKKCELSLITLDYLVKEYADVLLDYIEKYAFEKLSIHKLFITAYEFDEKKNVYFSDRYTYNYMMSDNVLFYNKYYNEICYAIYNEGGK